MKRLLLVAAVLAAGIASQAQVKFGAKLGANMYSLTGADADEFEESRKMKIGVVGGGMVNIPISSQFSIQPELLYSMEGNKQEESGASFKINLSYINIPVLVQLNTASGFYAETGPQVGFLMSAKGVTEFSGEEEEEDIKDELKGIGFSWAIGAGFKTKSGLGFGARYNLGLSSIVDEDDISVKSSGFSVGIFYMFGGEKK